MSPALVIPPTFLSPGVDNVPRSYGSVSICEIFVEDFLTFVIMLVLPPVVLAHTPCSVLVAFQFFQPLLLFLFSNLEKELQHQITVVRQLSFKTFNALDTLRVLLIRHSPRSLPFVTSSIQPESRNSNFPASGIFYKNNDTGKVSASLPLSVQTWKPP